MRKGECLGGLSRVIRPLGRGGHGSVFLAVHERSLRLAAIKEIPLNGRAWDSLEKSHFCHLDHEGIPRIYDLFEENGKGYLVMEYIPGRNLKEYKEEEGKLSTALLLELSGKLAEILVYLHGRTPPLVHGDIKPGNLILRADGVLYLVDFGAALKQGGERSRAYATKGFSPPEQLVKGGRADALSDLYSFGRTFQSLSDARQWHFGLRHIYRKCTAGNPARRYRSAKKLLRAIRLYQKRMYLYSLALCLGACALLAAGTLYQSIMEIQRDEQSYQTAILGNDVSAIQSVIENDPQREEGYWKLLEIYLSDESLTQEEAMELEAKVLEGEELLAKDAEGYGRFCYEMGLAYWYYYQGSGGKVYSESWFQKALGGKLEKGQRERAALYRKLGEAYEQKSRWERTGEGSFSYADFFQILEEMTEAMEGSGRQQEEWAKELVGRLYENGGEFAKAGISKERALGLLEKGKEGLSDEEMETWNMTEERLNLVYERQEET